MANDIYACENGVNECQHRFPSAPPSISPPEEQHQRAEKGLKVVVLIDVTLVVQLDVSKHLRQTSRVSQIDYKDVELM